MRSSRRLEEQEQDVWQPNRGCSPGFFQEFAPEPPRGPEHIAGSNVRQQIIKINTPYARKQLCRQSGCVSDPKNSDSNVWPVDSPGKSRMAREGEYRETQRVPNCPRVHTAKSHEIDRKTTSRLDKDKGGVIKLINMCQNDKGSKGSSRQSGMRKRGVPRCCTMWPAIRCRMRIAPQPGASPEDWKRSAWIRAPPHPRS